MPSRVTVFTLGLAFIATSLVLTARTEADDKHEHKADHGHAVIVEDSMHEFMEYVFQPTYKRLKVSMASQPADKAGWKAIKSDSLILAESCNLLFARAPEKNADDWNKHSVDSRDAGAKLYKAAGAKQFKEASTAYRSMLESCNACHRQFEKGRHILAP